jgi:transposase
MKPVVAGLYLDGGPRQLLDLQPAGEVLRRERCHEGAARVLGSITVDRLTEEKLLTKTCGIDWSEAQHDVAILDDQARVIARARVSDDAAGFGQLLELLAEHGDGEPIPIEIAIDRHGIVRGCLDRGWVHAVFRSIPGPRLGTASGTGRPAGNLIEVMR